MKHALGVARLELREWKALPVVALAAGAVPFLLGASGFARSMVESVYAYASSGGWVLTALLSGASVFTRDLRERRTAFLLGRPLSWRALWGGKLTAALGLTALAGFCASAPGWWLFVTPAAPLGSGGDGPSIVLERYVATALLLVGLGHWGALAVTARGWRLLADASIVLGLLFMAGRQGYLFLDTGVIVGAGFFRWLVAAPAACLLLASAVCFRQGRGDPRRAYAVFTTTCWLALGVAVCALAGYRHWLSVPRARSFASVSLDGVSPDGAWVSLGIRRQAGGYGPELEMLLRVDGGGAVRQGGHFTGPPTFSADARWCTWSHVANGLNVMLLRLEPGATPRRVAKLRHDRAAALLSPAGGTMLFTHEPGVFEAWSTASLRVGAVLAGVDDAGFLDERTAWVLRPHPRGRSLERIDLPTGRREPWVVLEAPPVAHLVLSPSRRDALAWTRAAGSWSLRHCDLSSGACRAVPLHDGEQDPTGLGVGAAFLSDGATVVSSGRFAHTSVRVRVLEADGRERWTITTGRVGVLIGEPRDGLLAIGCRDPGRGDRMGVAFVEVSTGRVVRREDGLIAQLSMGPDAPFLRGRAASFFVENSRGLVRLDVDTWRREPVALP